MTEHVFVVDDDALFGDSLGCSLRRPGYRATTAVCAEDALEIVDHQRPDLILLDIGLPGVDGFEALRRVRQRNPAPVIFVTLGPDLTHLANRQTIAAGTLPNTPGNPAGWIVNSQELDLGVTDAAAHDIAAYLHSQ